MTPRWRALAVFLVLLLVALAVLFDRTWRFGEVFSPADLVDIYYPWCYDQPRRDPTNPTRSDEAFYHYPLVVTHWDRLRRGDFPQWDPLVLSGTTAFHQGLDVGRAFSPLSAPFYLLPPDIATTVYAPLRLLCAGVLMWLYLAHAGLSRAARAGGALAFAFNGAFIVWLSAPMPTVALWLPLLALGVERVCSTGRLRDVAVLAFAAGMQFLGAYLPTSLVVAFVTATWAVGWLIPGPKRPGTAATAEDKPARPCATSERRLAATENEGEPGETNVIGTAGTSSAGGLQQRSAFPWWRSVVLRWTSGFGRTSTALAYLGLSAVAGTMLASVGLWPMLAALLGSPAAQRSMRPFTLPFSNAVTFAVPDFWGTPLLGNWWYPRPGNYPEQVTYLGVATLALAAAGVAVTIARRDRRGLLALLVALFALMQMYGVPPASWASALPGFRQMNPYRWNAALAFGTAILAGLGVDGFARARERRRVLAMCALACVTTLIAVAAAVVWIQLPTIRQIGLQAFERTLLSRFAVVAAAVCALAVVTAWTASPPARRSTAWLLALAIGADLLYAAHGFNPTIARSRLYPSAPGIEAARAELHDGRMAPVGPADQLIQGHVWGLFGLPTITGFDFYGDADYQRFIARASGLPPREAQWDYVGIPSHATPDARLLGLLGTTLIVTPPTDVLTTPGALGDVGELVPGRVVRQSFVSQQNGLRRIELLAGTYARQNDGILEIALGRDDAGPSILRQEVPSATLRNLDWIRLDFPEQRDSKGQRYTVEITGRAPPARAPTLLATTHQGLPEGQLTIDGTTGRGSLLLRTYASAPDRFSGAELIYAHDLNIYRNPLARPRAWFVERTVELPVARHLDEISKSGFAIGRAAAVDLSDVQRSGPAKAGHPPEITPPGLASENPIDKAGDPQETTSRDPAVENPVTNAGHPSGVASRGVSSDNAITGRPDSLESATPRVLFFTEHTPDRLTYRVSAPEGGWLVFRERYHPGWSLQAGTTRLHLVRADAVLMAAWIPAGAADLVLEFTSPGWAWACALSTLSIVGIGIAFLTRH